MALKRNLLIGGAALAAVGGIGYLARRAEIHSANVVSFGGDGAPSARLMLSYGDGSRPLSVIIDLVSASGASGSATIEGDATEATIPLSERFSGFYTITTTATYRLLGLPSVSVRTFEGTLAL